MQDDGESLCVAINAAALALSSAGIAMRDLIAATTCYAIKETPEAEPMIVVDLTAQELEHYTLHKPKALSYVTMAVCPQQQTGGLAFIRSVGAALTEETHELMMTICEQGCQELVEEMRLVVREEVLGEDLEDSA